MTKNPMHITIKHPLRFLQALPHMLANLLSSFFLPNWMRLSSHLKQDATNLESQLKALEEEHQQLKISHQQLKQAENVYKALNTELETNIDDLMRRNTYLIWQRNEARRRYSRQESPQTPICDTGKTQDDTTKITLQQQSVYRSKPRSALNVMEDRITVSMPSSTTNHNHPRPSTQCATTISEPCLQADHKPTHEPTLATLSLSNSSSNSTCSTKNHRTPSPSQNNTLAQSSRQDSPTAQMHASAATTINQPTPHITHRSRNRKRIKPAPKKHSQHLDTPSNAQHQQALTHTPFFLQLMYTFFILFLPYSLYTGFIRERWNQSCSPYRPGRLKICDYCQPEHEDWMCPKPLSWIIEASGLPLTQQAQPENPAINQQSLFSAHADMLQGHDRPTVL